MSGLLRRIRRSRTADDDGESPAEGQAAAPVGAPGPAATPAGDPATARTAPVVIERDPERPAGLEPEAVAVAPTGRHARLRRRLRYLRRAREVFLRDLGGLVYEIHRTGGGDMAAHTGVIGTKVARLGELDAEAHAIEGALAAPREETVVFQPGVGGTCDFCGELYGSSARYCSHCGSPTGSAVRATPAPLADRLRPSLPLPRPAAPAKPEEPTKTEEPAKPEAPAASEQPTVAEQPTEEELAAPPAAEAEPAEQPEKQDQPQPDPGRNPFSGIGNGHTEEHKPPDLSSGDPLARESRK
jgi:hypothetical protein